MGDLRQRLAEARLYLVCDVLCDEHLAACLRGGVEIVQLRAKRRPDAELLDVAARYRRLCDEHGALLIINDRPDLAVAVGADGVHVGQDDIPVAAARQLIGPERILGLSTHSPAQLDAAGATGAVDYIGVGPVNTTPTKPERPAVGTKLVRYAAAHAEIPFFAIGGIDPSTVAAVIEAGASRIAVVRALSEATDATAVARRLHGALAGSKELRVGAAQQP